jgi:predicted nucleotidyltransferase
MKLDTRNIDLVKQYFKDKPVMKAYLFGSFATGIAKQESDVDILVELDYAKPIGLDFVQMQIDLESILNKKVDLVSSNGLSKYIVPFIENEKILIYAK